MAKKWIVLYKNDTNELMWKPFDCINTNDPVEPYYEYLRSIGKHPGLTEIANKKWIDQYVEQS